MGMDILSALVTRLQDRFKAQIGTGRLSAFRPTPDSSHIMASLPLNWSLSL